VVEGQAGGSIGPIVANLLQLAVAIADRGGVMQEAPPLIMAMNREGIRYASQREWR
jgi:hypothetical protein